MTQTAPWPHDLEAAVAELRYVPGWRFTLTEETRGQDCAGLTLSIYPDKPDSQPPGTIVTLSEAKQTQTAVHREVPIEQVRVGDLAVSFRKPGHRLPWVVRGYPVNSISEHPFHGDLVTAKIEDRVTRYTPNHRCMVYAGDAFRDRFVVYLMSRGTSFRIGRTRGMTRAGGGKLKLGLMGRGFTEGADGIWVLGIYDDEGVAAVAEASYSWRFGLPMMTFRASNDPRAALTQNRVDDFWLNVGPLKEAALAALSEAGKDIRFPFWTYGTGKGSHRGLGMRYLTEVRACNIETGMEMIPLGGDDHNRVSITVSRERYDGPVYSLGVGASNDGLYVADGVLTHNSYHPESHVNTVFTYPVPAASFNRESWEEWLWGRIEDTENHERAEWFRFAGAPNQHEFVRLPDQRATPLCAECTMGRSDPRHKPLRRPFKPAHADGWDPSIVRTVVSETVTNTPNAGRLVQVPCPVCLHHHGGRMGEHFTIEYVNPCREDGCDCQWGRG